jgi:adenylate cyclase
MVEERAQRRLAAILAADVAGYSRLMSADEEGTLAQLKAHRSDLVDPKIRDHQGRIVKTTGDGMLVEFASVVNALRSAIDIQLGMAERNADVRLEKRIEFRIGINVGDVIIDGGDIYGDGVNVAARLEALAEPGGVCVSGRVQEDTRGKVDASFEDAGEQQLKNIAQPVRVYRLRLSGEATIARPTLMLPDKPSLAVLPFQNLSGNTDLDHLCDGITEDVITGLGRFRSLFVIDRHSSAVASQQPFDIAEIGRRLGVAYLVQGSLQRFGENVRITVRLVDASSRTQHWGEAYDSALSDILAIPDKVTGAIVSTLHGRVESSLLEQSRHKPALAAYECVLRGLKHLRGYGPDDNRRAVELFQQAMDLDPDYALARAYRAFADVVLHGYGDAPDAVLTQALSLAQTALDLDAGDGRCQWILGAIHLYRGDWRNADQHNQRAIALNPNDANAICSSGRMLARRGQVQEGIDRIREAMRLNPYHPEYYWHNLGFVLHMARKYADSAEAYGRMTRPGYWVLCRLAGCYAQLGRMNEAAEAAADALRLRPDFSLAKVRLREVDTAEVEHIKDGMRRAGLPE